jgi:hypothetical protein
MKKFVPKRRRLTESEVGLIRALSAITEWKQSDIANETGVCIAQVREVQQGFGLAPNTTHALPPATENKIRAMLAQGRSIGQITKELCVLRYRVVQILNEKKRVGLSNAEKRRIRADVVSISKLRAGEFECPRRWVQSYIRELRLP